MSTPRLKPLLHLLALAACFVASASFAAEKIPPAPARYFNDYVPLVSSATANELNAKLEASERATSNQLLVAIYPKMETDSSVEDYTVRVAQSWKVGQAGKDNGAVLFVFMAQRQVYIQVGYGLEPVLTDAIAKRIVEREIVPRFRSGDVEGGMRAAVDAMIAATKGEYQGTGKTVADQKGRSRNGGGFPIIAFVAIGIIMIVFGNILRGTSRNVVLGSPRYRRRSSSWWMGPPGGGGFGGGGSSGGGGFSGGGGSFGGGGAGGRW